MARGQERAVAIASAADPGQALDGLYVAGRRGAGEPDEAAVIAPPHPLYGGSMDSPVVSELAYGCAKAGLPSLRFNWRGIGASAGAPSGDLVTADADYDTALRHLAETHRGRIVACGYSFGAAAALRAAMRHPRVGRLVLVAPPAALIEDTPLIDFDAPVLIVSGALDRIAPPDGVASLARERAACRLVVVPEADHFFGAGLAEVGRATADWLAGGA